MEQGQTRSEEERHRGSGNDKGSNDGRMVREESEREMTETGETANSEFQPELSALRDNLTRYEIAAASERQARDLLVATWRDVLHIGLKQVGPIDPNLIHKVIDSMDTFLNHAGGRRK